MTDHSFRRVLIGAAVVGFAAGVALFFIGTPPLEESMIRSNRVKAQQDRVDNVCAIVSCSNDSVGQFEIRVADDENVIECELCEFHAACRQEGKWPRYSPMVFWLTILGFGSVGAFVVTATTARVVARITKRSA